MSHDDELSWSPTTCLFYANRMRSRYEIANTWPKDARPIDGKLADAYSGPAPAGHVRGADARGLPCWIALPPRDPIADLRHQAARLRQSAIDTILRRYTVMNAQTPSDWIAYIKSLSDIIADGETGRLQADALPALPLPPSDISTRDTVFSPICAP